MDFLTTLIFLENKIKREQLIIVLLINIKEGCQGYCLRKENGIN